MHHIDRKQKVIYVMLVMQNEKKTSRFIFSAEPSLLAAIDTWRAKQPDIPTRAEAVRRLIRGGLHTDRHLILSDETLSEIKKLR